MAIIYIDNKPYEIEDGQNLLNACLSLGFDIPYFCWHPAMHSVGACRQCAVKLFRDEKDTRGQIIMSCVSDAQDGMRISIDDPEVKQFRAGIIQWMMANHPHDCPVCDEGGECHLQDMTVMTGHTRRKFQFKKRTYTSQDLGPFLEHEMNRCIQCYRCVRFYRNYAGGRDLDVFGIHQRIYFGRFRNGPLESEFSGNLVEVCPTGVFTDKTLRKHYTRKWDLQTAPSVCVHCSVGCNTIPGERYKMLRRIRNRYNREVNGYFLCDRGRYGYEFVNSDRRIRKPFIRSDGNEQRQFLTTEEALVRFRNILSESSGVIGMGSPRASLESNFMLRTLVGPERFFSGVSKRQNQLLSAVLTELSNGPARSPSLHDMEQADAVLILGEDLTNSAPMMALAMRQAVKVQPMEMCHRQGVPVWNELAVRQLIQEKLGPLSIAAPAPGRLDDIASSVYYAAPQDIARLGFAVANEIDAKAPAADGLPEAVQMRASVIAQFLRKARRPLVVSGTGCGSEAVIHAAGNIVRALDSIGRKAELSCVVPEANSLGMAMLSERGLDEAIAQLETKQADTVIVLENDLFARVSRDEADRLFKAARNVVVLDHVTTGTTDLAHLVLPAGTFAESDGSFINNEGRAQRFIQVLAPEVEILESWRWIGRVMAIQAGSGGTGFSSLDDVLDALTDSLPVFAGVKDTGPPAEYRQHWMKIARQPHRYSGRTAMSADVTMHEPPPPMDPDSPMEFSMEGAQSKPDLPLIPRFWWPGWNSVQSLNKFQSEIAGPLVGGNPGVRLIEPRTEPTRAYFNDVPRSFEPRPDAWQFVSLYHIFGSEELSVLSPGIAERSPKPYVGLSPEDAALLGLDEGDLMVLKLDRSYELPLRIIPGLAQGVAGLPVGLPGLKGIDLPAWGEIRAAERNTV